MTRWSSGWQSDGTMMMMMYSNNDRQLICDVLAVKNTPIVWWKRAQEVSGKLWEGPPLPRIWTWERYQRKINVRYLSMDTFSQTDCLQDLTRWLQQKQILPVIYTGSSDSLHTQTCTRLPWQILPRICPMVSPSQAAFIPSNQTKTSFSPLGQFRLESLEINTWLHVIRNPGLAGMGPWRSGVHQAY